MTSLTIKLSEEMKARLENEARQSGVSVSALVREVVSKRLKSSARGASLHERAGDLCGAGRSGVPDLATNPAHLQGLGE